MKSKEMCQYLLSNSPFDADILNGDFLTYVFKVACEILEKKILVCCKKPRPEIETELVLEYYGKETITKKQPALVYCENCKRKYNIMGSFRCDIEQVQIKFTEI